MVAFPFPEVLLGFMWSGDSQRVVVKPAASVSLVSFLAMWSHGPHSDLLSQISEDEPETH